MQRLSIVRLVVVAGSRVPEPWAERRVLTSRLLWPVPLMTFKIHRASGTDVTTIRLIGRIQREHLDAVRMEIDASRQRTVLDLDEVTLVDVEAVRFLTSVERRGIELSGCPPFVREWMARERDGGQ